MVYIILIMLLPIIICLSYFLNREKIFIRSGNLFLTSFFEGLGSYLVILSLLLEGFIANPVLQIFLLILGLFILAYTNNRINDTTPEIDVQIETMKNIVLIFAQTILLFFVMLSIFRFQHFILQILSSILVVVAFNYLSIYMKRWFSNIWDRYVDYQAMFVSFSAIYTYLIIIFIGFIIIFFNFPKVTVNHVLNLEHSNSFYAYPDAKANLSNRYVNERLIIEKLNIPMDKNAYINQVDDHIFIFIKDYLIIYNQQTDTTIYSGPKVAQVNGVTVNDNNDEDNEQRLQSFCLTSDDCTEFTFPFTYGDVTYNTLDRIIFFEDLAYKETDTGVFTDDLLHLFDNEAIDSRLTTKKDKPFFGFGESGAVVTDIDSFQGYLFYLQVEEKDDYINIELKQIVEKDIDLDLPFYSHYKFGMLVFIFMIGFIPISNYDLYRTEIK